MAIYRHFLSFDVEFIKLQSSIKTWCGNIKTHRTYIIKS